MKLMLSSLQSCIDQSFSWNQNSRPRPVARTAIKAAENCSNREGLVSSRSMVSISRQVSVHDSPRLTGAVLLPIAARTKAACWHQTCSFLDRPELPVNATAEMLTQRFEPSVQLAKGQVIGIAALAALVLASLDYFKLQLERSIVRAACVAGVGFVALSALFWFKTGRYGCQTVVLDESGLTLETKDNRSVLPWAE